MCWTLRLEIAYDGARFAGWAVQPGLRTVQGVVEGALARIVGEHSGLTVAGRTDAGVHAWGQVASVAVEGEVPDRLAERLNAVLPRDVAVRAAEPAPEGFDARRDARSRTYCYRVLLSPVRDPFEEGRALWWPRRADPVLLERCAETVRGTHDFTAFTPTDTEHVRFERDVLRSEWVQGVSGLASPHPQGHPGNPDRPGVATQDLTPGVTPGVWCYWIEADAFMRHMVRVLVGTMLEVAGGRRTLDDFRELLRGAPRERAGETAPPHGLYLAGVTY